jgi:[glutamine synthetase] adenylyltransferase / [glutamine synthetase]-adenylyl-L-tyrosine phosphorylase
VDLVHDAPPPVDPLPPDLFENPRRAAKVLESFGAALGAEAAGSVRELCARAGDPDALIAGFERVQAAIPRKAAERAIPALFPLLAASELFPRQLAIRRPLVRHLLNETWPGGEKPAAQLLHEARGALRGVRSGDTEGLMHRLRLFKYRELLRIGARDVRLAPMAEIGRETSALAQAIVSAAHDWLFAGLLERYGAPEVPGFCILGMGKLGGEDLNFSSDIDLVYVFRADGQTSGGARAATPHVQLFTRLCEELTRALSASTADGFCYRVDLNLRPQGRSGAIVLSLPATLAYYETYGRTWERAALIKARPVAGDASLGNELLDALSPFVWRRSLDLKAVDALREIKAQIDLRAKASADDVKLGPGGIREIEFFVNALQLLHGGKNAPLRERNTLRALRKLEMFGLLSSQDADALEEAYSFLRRVENRLQMVEERQTQTLPEAERERHRLAWGLHFASWDAFSRELARHRDFVRRAFSTLLGQTARGELPDEPLLALALDPDTAPAARRKAMAERGFADPDRALAALERLSRVQKAALAQGSSDPGTLAIKLLAEVVRTPDPDQALFHLSEFIGHLHAPAGYLDLLGGAALARRRLLNLFGQSDFLSRYFLGHPELLDALVQSEPGDVLKPPDRIRQELASRLQRHDDPEGRLAAMRRYRNEELLRIGMHDISGEIAVPEVAAQLTAIADAALDEALFMAESEQRERYGPPVGPQGTESLAVIAMGKLGGRELGYHSDLDLIFVYSGEGPLETAGGTRGRISHHEYFAKIAQRLITFLQMQLREGYLYTIDARLRPSGNQGALVVSQAAFLDHHQRRAQLWERQALIKARGVAGDARLSERVLAEVIHPLVYERPLPEGAAAEIDRLRTRMEREVAHETADQLNLKSGRGGLVDVEFATQYLQLLHGGRAREIRRTNTLEALEALERAGSLPAADAQVLRGGYLFHRRVENRLRLVQGHPLSHMPTHGRALALLARRLGYIGPDPGAAFLSDYRTYTARVRDVYARLLRSSP